MSEVIGDGGGIAADENAYKDQAKQGERFGAGEDILNELANAHAPRVEEGEKDNHQYSDELLDRQANSVLR